MTDVLKLVLTDHWFEEIKSGRKTHEYRQAKPFWDKRIGWIKDAFELKDIDAEVYSDVFIPNVIFQKAYRKNPETMEFTIKDVNCVWGADTDLKIDDYVYDIELGERIR